MTPRSHSCPLEVDVEMNNATESTLSIFDAAAELAKHLGHASPTTKHVLLVMLQHEGTVAERALDSSGVHELKNDLAEYQVSFPDISLTELFDRGNEEAKVFRHSYVGTEHVLLAICTTLNCHGAKALESIGPLGVRETICRSVIEVIGQSWKRWRRKHQNAFST